MSKSESIEVIIKNPSKEELGEKISNLAFSIEEGFKDSDEEWIVIASNDKREVRSIAQNALGAIYYAAINKEFGYTKKDAKERCKVDFGLQALLEQTTLEKNKKASQAAISVMRTLRVIKFKWMSYEDKIEVMQDLPCTRIMTPAIFAEFLKQVEVYYADKGLILESINEGLRNKAYDV